MQPHPLWLGVMSGTSMDGVDAVLADFGPDDAEHLTVHTLSAAHCPYPAALRERLLALQTPGPDELHAAMACRQELAALTVQAIEAALAAPAHLRARIRAVGVHGQTIRHRPERGFTLQLNHPAEIAERVGIDVVADFRARDVAAGGQGAPLVPAFHQALFAHHMPATARADCAQAIVNIGGIANVTLLPRSAGAGQFASPAQPPMGFDTGPGNMLMDAWIHSQHGQAYDDDGRWAAQGAVDEALLQRLLAHHFFSMAPPKSTGRDLFHLEWLKAHLQGVPPIAPANVQATLLECTARSISAAIPPNTQVWVCGGGGRNGALMQRLNALLTQTNSGNSAAVGGLQWAQSTQGLGVDPMHMEALAFAWLARQTVLRRPGNLPSVTGARGPRVLGAIYPA